jgi:hypothetical protein
MWDVPWWSATAIRQRARTTETSMSILISFLYLLLYIAIILLIAAIIVWGLRWIGIAIDPTVYKIGQAIVGLLILIAVVVWVAGLIGYAPARWPWYPPP